jgi:hypothetical protein
MSQYFYQADKLAFQYNALTVLEELRFRLFELTAVSEQSIAAFHKAVQERSPGGTDGHATLVKYRFSSAIGLIQTLKDVLPIAIPCFAWDSFVTRIPESATIQNLRNALIHDGQQAVNMYADGKYFVAVNIRRQGVRKQPFEILASEDDVETLTLRFYELFTWELAELLGQLDGAKKLRGQRFSPEWFQGAAEHPALARFQIQVPDYPAQPDTTTPQPLEEARAVALEITGNCRRRLEKLAAMPKISFP